MKREVFNETQAFQAYTCMTDIDELRAELARRERVLTKDGIKKLVWVNVANVANAAI